MGCNNFGMELVRSKFSLRMPAHEKLEMETFMKQKNVAAQSDHESEGTRLEIELRESLQRFAGPSEPC